jgi:exopolyphosphatase/guanosine-5'-triphosphate,3'-diphosphate pyrophosphatase
MKNVGIIDLGSNTFHLLIAKIISPQGFEVLYKEAYFVKLAAEGIEKIGETPFRMGIERMCLFAEKCRDFKVTEIKAMGTAALRRAENAQHFIQQVYEQTGIEVSVISGDEEAKLISEGVELAIPFIKEKVLIMDIGGGSVEFIIYENGLIRWAKSYPIGIAILFRIFHHTDPISEEEITSLIDFLRETLADLLMLLREQPIYHLVGASGTFDVVEELLSDISVKNKYATTIAVADVIPVLDKIIKKSLSERLSHREITETRAEMIVAAMVLIKFILQAGHFNWLTYSSFAMKEGILRQLMKG